jgi:hypothetical protein
LGVVLVRWRHVRQAETTTPPGTMQFLTSEIPTHVAEEGNSPPPKRDQDIYCFASAALR